MVCEYYGRKDRIDPESVPEIGEKRTIYNDLPQEYCSIDGQQCTKPSKKCWKRKGWNWDRGTALASFNQKVD